MAVTVGPIIAIRRKPYPFRVSSPQKTGIDPQARTHHKSNHHQSDLCLLQFYVACMQRMQRLHFHTMCKSKPVEDRKLNRQATALGFRPCFRNNPPTLLCATLYSDRVCADMNEGWKHWQTIITMGEGLVYHGPILDWLDLLGWTSVVKIVTKRNTIKTFCAMWFPQMAKISADMRCTWEDFNLDTQKNPITESVLHDTWPSLGIHETYIAGKRSICTLAPARLFALSSSPRGALLSSSDVHGTLVCCQLLSAHAYLIYFVLGNTQNIVQTCPNCPLVVIGIEQGHGWFKFAGWYFSGLQYDWSTKKSVLVLLLGF